MVAWFLIAIGTVAFFAYIAVTGVTTVETTGTYAGRADTIRRIDAVASALSARASSIQGDGVIYAPAGVAGTGEYLLPADLQPTGLTSFGSRFQYCPMGLDLSGQNDTVAYQGGSYGISTAALNGKAFVTTGRLPTTAAGDPNVIGFVLAQLTPTLPMPGCGQIVRSGDNYTAPNGIVRVLRRSGVAEVDAGRNSDGATWYVTPTGTGDGRSWSNPASLANAMNAYRTSLGGSFTIRLAAGTYDAGGNMFDQTLVAMAPKKEASSLLLIGNGVATVNSAAMSVPSNLELRNVRAANSAIVMDGGRYLKLTDAYTGSIVMSGRSRLLMNGTNFVYGSPGVAAAIQVLNGSTAAVNNTNGTSGVLVLSYQRNLPAMIVDSASTAAINVNNLTISPIDANAAGSRTPSLFVLRPNSTLNFRNTTINVNGSSEWAFAVGGNLGMMTTRMNFNAYTWVGLQGNPGGEMSLYDIHMQGSSPAQYGIAAQSTSKVSGWGNLYNGTRCWYRGDSSVFRMSPLGVAGDVSTVSQDEGWAANMMSAQPTAQQVADYQAMRQRNVERVDLRNRLNTTGNNFVCQQAPAATWTSCATENGYCALPAITNGTTGVVVRYGANNAYRQIVTKGGIPCNNTVFGDPIVGTVKTCQYAS